jgi:erythromycin esterase-like protein
VSVHEYVTHPATGTVHTVSTMHLMIADRPRTRCGQPIACYGDDRWTFGDETVSGIAATCATCREAVRQSNPTRGEAPMPTL